VRYAFSDVQFVEVLPLPAGTGINRLDHVAFNTDDAEGLRKYLVSKAWKTPAKVTKGTDGNRWFSVSDPEGNEVQFVQLPRQAKAIVAPNVISHRIIHVGILVHRSAVEDTFYRDLLGFRPYWFGGMKEGRVDWVSLHPPPDSHDWIEYMLEATHSHDDPGSGIPNNMTQNFHGVLNHVALGVASVPDAYNVLEAGKRLEGRHDGRPTKVGLDGKYEFNMYDPDGVRDTINGVYQMRIRPRDTSFAFITDLRALVLQHLRRIHMVLQGASLCQSKHSHTFKRHFDVKGATLNGVSLLPVEVSGMRVLIRDANLSGLIDDPIVEHYQETSSGRFD
jgi:catechol 2,3-dioxygenase-like lactoylglutathione lyase family enzyme